jgi:hypothetical protein
MNDQRSLKTQQLLRENNNPTINSRDSRPTQLSHNTRNSTWIQQLEAQGGKKKKKTEKVFRNSINYLRQQLQALETKSVRLE